MQLLILHAVLGILILTFDCITNTKYIVNGITHVSACIHM